MPRKCFTLFDALRFLTGLTAEARRSVSVFGKADERCIGVLFLCHGFHSILCRIIVTIWTHSIIVARRSHVKGFRGFAANRDGRAQCSRGTRCHRQVQDGLLRQFSLRGVPVFLTCDDELCGRIACGQANYIATGKMVVELLSGQLPKYNSVLLLAGDETIPSHINVIRAFEEYMAENHVMLHTRKIFGYYDEASLYREPIETLDACGDITGVFSVSARLSVVLMKAIEEKQPVGRVRIVASDLFRDTKTALENGTIQSIIFKAPEQQAYPAVRLMMDYILRAAKPKNPVNYVESKLILHSSLPFYES